MLSYCLKCKKNAVRKCPRVGNEKNENHCFYQDVLCVEAKIQELLKNKKLVDY